MKILFKQKLKTKRHLRKKYIRLFIILLLVSFVILTASLTYEFFVTSPFFNLKDVTVRGNNLVPTSLIIRKADLPLNQNLFKIKTTKDNVLDIRLLKAVSFRKSFPNSIVIYVEERVPVALLLFNNKLFYLDEEGKLLSGINSNMLKKLKNKLDYPVITGIDETFNFKERVKFIDLSLQLLKDISKLADGDNIFISEINVNKLSGLSIITTNNTIPIIFGFEDFGRKASYLKIVLSDSREKNLEIAEINLDFNKKVVVKKKR